MSATVRHLYRATLRAADRLESAILWRQLPRSSVLRAAPVQDERVSREACHLREAVRWHYRRNAAAFDPSEREEAIEEGFWCLRWADSRAAALSSPSWVPRPVRPVCVPGNLLPSPEKQLAVCIESSSRAAS